MKTYTSHLVIISCGHPVSFLSVYHVTANEGVSLPSSYHLLTDFEFVLCLIIASSCCANISAKV